MARGDLLLLKINCHLIVIKSVSLNSHYEGRRNGRRGNDGRRDGRRGEDWGRCVSRGDDGDWGSAVSSGRRTASSSSRGFVAKMYNSCPEGARQRSTCFLGGIWDAEQESRGPKSTTTANNFDRIK